jgi:hypothetical protein
LTLVLLIVVRTRAATASASARLLIQTVSFPVAEVAFALTVENPALGSE